MNNLTTIKTIDPRFLNLWREGKIEKNTLCKVIAKVENLEAWKKLEVEIKSCIIEDGGWIITTQIPAGRFEEISQLSFVTSLKLGEIVIQYLK